MAMILSFPNFSLRARYSLIRESQGGRKVFRFAEIGVQVRLFGRSDGSEHRVVTGAEGAEELIVEELRALIHEVFVAEEECARAEEVFLECPREDIIDD
ncbi:unnamed protein product [Alternaria alternata]